MSRERLVALLESAARDATFPETPALAERVRARIDSGPLPVAEIELPRTRPRVLRPALVAVAVFGVALAVTLSLSVTARRAVADLLGVAGIEVTFGEDPPSSPVPARSIPLGDPVTRAVATEQAGFEVRVPAAAAGTPAFYFDPAIGDSGEVSVVYPSGAATMADVDLLVTQFAASLPESYVKKLGTLGSTVRYLSVRGHPAYWIGGDPHYFFYEGRDGSVRHEDVRLAGNVLLWEEDGLTYRIEGAASLQQAQMLAVSLR